MRKRPQTLAMILAGGRVDELNVLTFFRPKSAVPFGGLYRVIDFPLSNLMHSGIEKIAVLSQYRSYSLINHLGNGAAWDMVGRHRGVSVLPPFTGSEYSSWYNGPADAVYQNLDFIQYHRPTEVLILSGDHIYQMDYQQMIEYHRDHDADLTIAFTPIAAGEASRYGVAGLAGDDDDVGGRVIDYQEKPVSSSARWASMTVYCFKPELLYETLSRFDRDRPTFEFGRDVIPHLVDGGANVHGYRFRGYWGYTRTIDEYWRTSQDLLGDDPGIDLDSWGVRTNLEHRGICDFQPMTIAAGAEVSDSLIYNGCRVRGEVSRSILFPGVVVEEGASVRDSILFFNCRVGRNAGINRLVSDVEVDIGAGARIGVGDDKRITVIGWKNRVEAGTVISGGCVVYPGLEPGTVVGEFPPRTTIR